MAVKLSPRAGVLASLTTALLVGSTSAQTVTVELQGTVPASCDVSTNLAYVNLGTLTANGRKVIPFRVRCNAPFRFALSSRSGGLLRDQLAPLATGFTSQIAYEAAVNIPTHVGALAGSCPSTKLKGDSIGCTFPDSGQGIAVEGESSITVTWTTDQELWAGSYSDVLTLSITPKI